MTTSRRHIPIDNHSPATGANPATDPAQAVEQAAGAQLTSRGEQVAKRWSRARRLSDSLLRLRAEFENFRKRHRAS